MSLASPAVLPLAPADPCALLLLFRRTIGGFALQPDSRPTTPLPTATSAQTVEDGESTPTPATATLDQELQSVMAGIGSFWGKVRKQVSALFWASATVASGLREGFES